MLCVRLRSAIFPARMISQASCALVALCALVLRISAWTDATCKSSFGTNLQYACNWGASCACGSVTTSAGANHCCYAKPSVCAPLGGDPTFSDCSSVSYCHTSWANYGSCTGCGAGGVQKQTQPCVSGATGPPNSRTVSVICGSIFITCPHFT